MKRKGGEGGSNLVEKVVLQRTELPEREVAPKGRRERRERARERHLHLLLLLRRGARVRGHVAAAGHVTANCHVSTGACLHGERVERGDEADIDKGRRLGPARARSRDQP